MQVDINRESAASEAQVQEFQSAQAFLSLPSTSGHDEHTLQSADVRTHQRSLAFKSKASGWPWLYEGHLFQRDSREGAPPAGTGSARPRVQAVPSPPRRDAWHIGRGSAHTAPPVQLAASDVMPEIALKVYARGWPGIADAARAARRPRRERVRRARPPRDRSRRPRRPRREASPGHAPPPVGDTAASTGGNGGPPGPSDQAAAVPVDINMVDPAAAGADSDPGGNPVPPTMGGAGPALNGVLPDADGGFAGGAGVPSGQGGGCDGGSCATEGPGEVVGASGEEHGGAQQPGSAHDGGIGGVGDGSPSAAPVVGGPWHAMPAGDADVAPGNADSAGGDAMEGGVSAPAAVVPPEDGSAAVVADSGGGDGGGDDAEAGEDVGAGDAGDAGELDVGPTGGDGADTGAGHEGAGVSVGTPSSGVLHPPTSPCHRSPSHQTTGHVHACVLQMMCRCHIHACVLQTMCRWYIHACVLQTMCPWYRRCVAGTFMHAFCRRCVAGSEQVHDVCARPSLRLACDTAAAGCP